MIYFLCDKNIGNFLDINVRTILKGGKENFSISNPHLQFQKALKNSFHSIYSFYEFSMENEAFNGKKVFLFYFYYFL
jgi:hypothetical protein